MPAIAAHYLFGQEVYKELVKRNRKDIIALIRKHKLDYNIGLQGPDPLLYYKPTTKNEVSSWSHKIHEEPAHFFLRNAQKDIRESRDLRTFVYALGFVSHYVLDKESHPVVREWALDAPSHVKLETELDRELLLREILDRDAKHREEKYIKKHTEVSGFKLFRKKSTGMELHLPMQFYSPKPSVKPEKIQRYKFIIYERGLEDAIAPLYPGIKKRQLKQALDSFIKYTKILYSPRGTNAAVIRKIQALTGKTDTMSSLALTSKRFEDFVEPARKIVPVYDQSVSLAADMLINFHDAVRFGTALSEYFEENFG